MTWRIEVIGREAIGILIGGAVPAVLLGIFSYFQKAGIRAGATPGLLLVLVGAGTAVVGAVFMMLLPGPARPLRAGALLYSIATGLVWATAVGLVSTAISVYDTPLSKLVPVFNTNTLVAVVLGLVVFREWQEVQSPKLLVGTVLIIIGGSLAATA